MIFPLFVILWLIEMRAVSKASKYQYQESHHKPLMHLVSLSIIYVLTKKCSFNILMSFLNYSKLHPTPPPPSPSLLQSNCEDQCWNQCLEEKCKLKAVPFMTFQGPLCIYYTNLTKLQRDS